MHKYILLSLYSVTYTYVCKDDHLVLGNQLVNSFLRTFSRHFVDSQYSILFIFYVTFLVLTNHYYLHLLGTDRMFWTILVLLGVCEYLYAHVCAQSMTVDDRVTSLSSSITFYLLFWDESFTDVEQFFSWTSWPASSCFCLPSSGTAACVFMLGFSHILMSAFSSFDLSSCAHSCTTITWLRLLSQYS